MTQRISEPDEITWLAPLQRHPPQRKATNKSGQHHGRDLTQQRMGERQADQRRQYKGNDEAKALTPPGGRGLGFPPRLSRLAACLPAGMHLTRNAPSARIP